MWNRTLGKTVRLLLLLLVVMAGLSGCKTSRNAATSGSGEYLSSKVQLTIPHKDAIYNVNGNLKLKKGEIVQLSFLMPILRTEVARIEVTPENILLVDRINHRYVRTTKEELKNRLPKKWTYNRLEDLIFEVSASGGKKTITGADFGLSQLQKAKVELSDFSMSENNVKPTTLSSRYDQVSLDELLQFLMSL